MYEGTGAVRKRNYGLDSEIIVLCNTGTERKKKLRKNNIAYIRQIFPDTQFVENKGMGHEKYFTPYPKEFCKHLMDFIEQQE